MTRIIFLPIMVLLLAADAFGSCLDDLLAISKNNELLRTFNHIEFEDTNDVSSSEIILRGRLNGQWVELGNIMYEKVGNAIDLIYVHSSEDYRRMGIQTYMFQYLMQRYPETNQWNIFSLSSVNRYIFTERLQDIIINLNPYLFRSNTHATSQRIIHGQMIDFITSSTDEIQTNIINDAINATASMRSYQRLGFLLCPSSPHLYLDEDDLINISFRVCR